MLFRRLGLPWRILLSITFISQGFAPPAPAADKGQSLINKPVKAAPVKHAIMSGDRCVAILSGGIENRLPHFQRRRGDVSTIEMPTPQTFADVIKYAVATNYMKAALKVSLQKGQSPVLKKTQGLILPQWTWVDAHEGYQFKMKNKEEVEASLRETPELLRSKGRAIAEHIWAMYKRDFRVDNAIASNNEFDDMAKQMGMSRRFVHQARASLGRILSLPHGEDQIISIIQSSLFASWHLVQQRIVAEIRYDREFDEAKLNRDQWGKYVWGWRGKLAVAAMGWGGTYLLTPAVPDDLQFMFVLGSVFYPLMHATLGMGGSTTDGVLHFSSLREISTTYEKVLKEMGLDLREIEPQTPFITLTNADWNADLVIPDFKPSPRVGADLDGVLSFLQSTPQDLDFHLLNFNEWITGSIPEGKLALLVKRLLDEDLRDFRKTTAEYRSLIDKIRDNYDERLAAQYLTQINDAYGLFVNDLLVRLEKHREIRSILLTHLSNRKEFLQGEWEKYLKERKKPAGERVTTFSQRIAHINVRPELIDEVDRLEKEYQRLMNHYDVTNRQLEITRVAFEEIGRQFTLIADTLQTMNQGVQVSSAGIQIGMVAETVNQLTDQMTGLFANTLGLIPEPVPIER